MAKKKATRVSSSFASYKTAAPDTWGTSLFEDRGSKFYGFACHVESDDDVDMACEQVKQKIQGARHYVPAWRLYEAGREIYFDDGEPTGTAGVPVLNAIKGAELKDTAVVVARIFGGTLLGKGGLMRAYTKAAVQAIEDAKIVLRALCCRLDVQVDYSRYEPLREHLRTVGISPDEEVFTDTVALTYYVESERVEDVVADITNFCHGDVDISIGQEELRYV